MQDTDNLLIRQYGTKEFICGFVGGNNPQRVQHTLSLGKQNKTIPKLNYNRVNLKCTAWDNRATLTYIYNLYLIQYIQYIAHIFLLMNTCGC